ncbi:hypothetical protein CYMTET_19163 [Cymbomonas tetramitiformis]|uniref:Uncharacterized protein n=1 Tax=Cymbomonas tetramitiformis TaxID=36881 RepID=A0AAE0G6S6_9CHLO|nr:hypothetical protein CYMTET_19163 [Cymbomonas tetramitiformis]
MAALWSFLDQLVYAVILLSCFGIVARSQQASFTSLSENDASGSLGCEDEPHHFVTTFSPRYDSLTISLFAFKDPVSEISSILMEITRDPTFESAPVALVEGADEITIGVSPSDSYGDYYLRLLRGGLYCPAGYHLLVKANAAAPSKPLNATLLFQSNVRSRLLPVNKYDSMCSVDYYVENPHKCFGGADRRAAYIESVKVSQDHVICLDGGNVGVGTTFFNHYGGRADAELLVNYVPYDIYVPQRFDFAFGESQLDRFLTFIESQTAGVLSNVDWTATVLVETSLKRYAVREYDGRQVGFLGFVEPDIKWYAPSLSAGFILNPDVQDLQEEARIAAQLALTLAELHEEHPHCNIVIATGGSSQLCREVLQHSSEIDVCIATEATPGETIEPGIPELITNAVGNNALMVAAGTGKSFGKHMGNLWVNFDALGLVDSWGARLVNFDAALNMSDETVLQRLRDYEADAAQKSMRVVGKVTSTVDGQRGQPDDNNTWPACRNHDCQMGRMSADALLAYCSEEFGSSPCDLSLQNGEGWKLHITQELEVQFPLITQPDAHGDDVASWSKDCNAELQQCTHTKLTLESIQARALGLIQADGANSAYSGAFPQMSNMRIALNPDAEIQEETVVYTEVYDATSGEWQRLQGSRAYRASRPIHVPSQHAWGYNRMDFGINMENALINYLNQTSPYTPASRDSLLACIGKDRYTILEAWPKDAQHCRILESSGASVILACDEGKYRHVYINGTQECRPCQAGAFSANFSTETACVPCPPGQLQEEAGMNFCQHGVMSHLRKHAAWGVLRSGEEGDADGVMSHLCRHAALMGVLREWRGGGDASMV